MTSYFEEFYFMDYQPQEIKAGLMVVISIIILVVFLFAISGLRFFESR